MNEGAICPIWGMWAVEFSRDYIISLESPRAGGYYQITREAELLLQDCDDRMKVRLTTWLVEQRRLGNPRPKITEKTISEAEQWRNKSAIRRADDILVYLAQMTQTLGKQITFHAFLPPHHVIQPDNENKIYLELLAYSECVDREELIFLLDHLKNLELIRYDSDGSGGYTCVLTVDGHARLAKLEETDTASSRAFVAMWFDDSMSDAWKLGFCPAIREAGYEPVRIDQQEHINKIDDEVIAEIRRARFVVADFTHGDKGARGGVYYEAGFAHGLDIPVIFTCRKDLLHEIHFDTRQYNHILWTEPDELRMTLAHRIIATVGDGPHKRLD